MNKPDPSGERALAAYYAEMSDRELLELGSEYESLTDAAKPLLRAEFERRSLPAPDLTDSPEWLKFDEMVTVRQYRDPAAAGLAKCALDSAGIQCYLRDENIVRLDWLWSNLLGGIRLQVAKEDLEAAESILSGPVREPLPMDGEEDYE
ncbi:MAG: DUF2007 domain-containing protein [Silvibacterium sp.]